MTPIEQKAVDNVEISLGYYFKNKYLLLDAITAPSYGRHFNVNNYNRYEFLGDKILGAVVAYLSISRAEFKINPEGLHLLFSDICSNKNLAYQLERLKIDEYILYWPLKFKSFSGSKTHADIYEAIIGAIFLDSDFETVTNFILETALKHCITIHQSAAFLQQKQAKENNGKT